MNNGKGGEHGVAIKIYFHIGLIAVFIVDALGILQSVQEAQKITKIDKARKVRAFSSMILGFFLGGTLCLVGEIIPNNFSPMAVPLLILGLFLISYGILRNIFVIMKFAELQDKGW